MVAAKAYQEFVTRVTQEIARISTADCANQVLDAIWNAATEAERDSFARRHQDSLWRVFDRITGNLTQAHHGAVHGRRRITPRQGKNQTIVASLNTVWCPPSRRSRRRSL